MSKDLVVRALKTIGGRGSLIDIQEAMHKLDPDGNAWLYASNSLHALAKWGDVEIVDWLHEKGSRAPRRKVWALTVQGMETT